jgi:nucleotide-binding universal stress UspA family protein
MTNLSSESMQPNPEERVIWPSVHLETILVPTDLRPDSKAALFFAQALAQKFETNLILLHVFSETYSSDAEVDAGEARLLDMTREDAVREVPVWNSNCVISIPSAGALSELAVPLNNLARSRRI